MNMGASKLKGLALLLLLLVTVMGCQKKLVVVDSALIQNPRDPAVINGQLDNGFSYFLRSANSSELKRNIEIRLVVKAGSIHERDSELGYAHLLEHVVFRGTNRFSGPQIEALLEEAGLRWGVDVNATTHYGATIYRFSLTESEAELLPDVLSLAADFMHAVNFDPQDIEREKKIVGAEWRFRYGHRNFVVDPLVNSALEGSHYHIRPPVGDLAVVKVATADSLREFWSRHYRASNAALIVTGNIVPWELDALIEENFSRLPVANEETLLKIAETFRPIKGQPEVDYLTYVNPDLISPQVSLNFISRVKETDTVGSVKSGFREDLLFKAVGHLLIDRLSATQSCSAGTLHNSQLETGQSINRLEVDVVDTDYLTCLQALSVYSSRLFKNGLIDAEYQQLQQSFRNIALEAADQYRLSSPEDLAARLTQMVVYGTPVLPASLLESAYLEMIDSVNIAEFNKMLAEIPSRYKTVYGVSGPFDTNLPQKSLMQLATESADKNSFSIAVPEQTILQGALKPDQLLDNLASVASHLPKVKKVHHKDDYHEWRLSNGARVIFQQDTRHDYIALAAIAPGGYLYAGDGLARAAKMLPRFIGVNGAGGYLQKSLQRLRSEKSLVSQVQVNATHHAIQAYGVSEDVNLMLELVSAYFDEPVIVEPASSRILNKLNTERRAVDLESSFWTKFDAANSGVANLDTSHMRQVQSSLFRSPSDFTFVFVGNVEPDILARELARLERHAEERLDPVRASLVAVNSSGSDLESVATLDEQQRMNVGLFHSCVVPSSQRVNADLNLQLLSDIIERRLRFDLRENSGLSYQLDARLLSDTTDDNRRYHQIEYSVSPRDNIRARGLISEVLNAIGYSGVTEQELKFALKRERKRRRDVSYDYVALAHELALAANHGAPVQNRSVGDISLGEVNRLAQCFSADNTTYVVQDQVPPTRQVLSFD